MKAIVSILFFILSITTGLKAGGDEKITTQSYIETWKGFAISNMQTFGIPASIILAQGILESGSGNSKLAKEGNNHFGIKCHGWEGEKMYHDDDKKGECFRVYENAEMSYQDHALFLKNKSRYAFLFEYKSDDYKAWAKGLKKAGYATNPKYPSLLINIINRYELDKYDKMGAEELAEMVRQKKAREKEQPSKPKLMKEEVVISLTRTIAVSDNRIKFTNAKEGDRIKDVAEDLDMAIWQIRKYNEVPENYEFTVDEVIYLQPKRRKNCKLKQYQVEEGESLLEVSQKTGVKTKHLLRLNNLSSATLKGGELLELCKKK